MNQAPLHGKGVTLQIAWSGVLPPDGAFRDWFAPHDAHVYRFRI